MTEELTEELDEETGSALTEAQIHVLYTRGLINRATWVAVLRGSRSTLWIADGQRARRTCASAIDALVALTSEAVRTAVVATRAASEARPVGPTDAAQAMIREKLGLREEDLAAVALAYGPPNGYGTSVRELIRYALVVLEVIGRGESPQEEAP